jgi:hypothetical protein
MPNIENLKKTKKKKLKKTNLPTKVKTTKSKLSPVAYYNCLLTQAQND